MRSLKYYFNSNPNLSIKNIKKVSQLLSQSKETSEANPKKYVKCQLFGPFFQPGHNRKIDLEYKKKKFGKFP